MSKISLPKDTETTLIELSNSRNVYLEGNILKVIETENEDFQEYLSKAIKNDDAQRKKRLEITKKVQVQNKELQQQKKEINDDFKNHSSLQ